MSMKILIIKKESLWIRMKVKVKKLLSKCFISIPISCIKIPWTIIAGVSKMKHLPEKFIANKTNRDNMILVKQFPGAQTKATKHYVSSDSEKN